MKQPIIYIAFLGIVLWGMGGCTAPRRNTAYNRWLMGFNTRYNVYFNGHQAYLEALANLEKTPAPDYVTLIDLHPVDELIRSQRTSGSFDRTIEKCQKAIATRSFKYKPRRNPSKMRDPEYRQFLKQEEYNPFLHNAWMLMAKARYYKGDLMSSLATYLYITRHFAHLPQVVQEAQIGMLQNYVALGWKHEAEDVMHQIDIGPALAASLVPVYSQAVAQLQLSQHKFKEAIPPLRTALTGKLSKAQRTRLTFALGQLYQQTDDNIAAYQAYGKVIKLNPLAEVEFNARIRQTEVFPSGNTVQIFSRLKSMQRNPRNKEYLDQVFYAMGNVKLKENDTLQALNYYRMAIDTSKSGGITKAMPEVVLGDLYFARKQYALAQPCYSDAANILKPIHKEYSRVKLRAEVLDELVVFVENVHLQDSLQTLVRMPEAERLAAIDKIIEGVKRAEALEQQRAEREKLEAQQQTNLDLAQTQTPMSNRMASPTMNTGDNSWYFYNTMLVSNGKTDFQQRWGRRKLEDNWRRRNKTVLSTIPDETIAQTEGEVTNHEGQGSGAAKDTIVRSNDVKSAIHYLQQLPFTEEEMAESNAIIEEGLYNMAVIYTEKLNDYPLAISTYEELLRRFPQTERRLEIFYHLFLIGYRLDDSILMETNKKRIIDQFPLSKQGIALADPNYLRNLTHGAQIEDSLYQSAYKFYLEGEMDRVQASYSDFSQNYPLSKILPKFIFIQALSYVPSGNTAEFKTALNRLITDYPQSDVAQPASEMLKGLAQGGKLASGSSPSRGMTWKSNLLGDSTSLAAAVTGVELKPFVHTPDTAHLLMLAFPTDSVNLNKMLYDVAAYNFTTFKMLGLDLETRVYGQTGLLLIKGFESMGEVLEYKRLLSEPTALGTKISPAVQMIPISEGNFDLLSKGRSVGEYLEFFETEILKVSKEDEEVLPSE